MTPNNPPAPQQEPRLDFGVRLMEGEEIILSLRPFRFVRYIVSIQICTIVGIIAVPIAYLWALIAERRYHYWLTNKRVIWCHGFIGYKIRSVPGTGGGCGH